jgi:hypothetical protein
VRRKCCQCVSELDPGPRFRELDCIVDRIQVSETKRQLHEGLVAYAVPCVAQGAGHLCGIQDDRKDGPRQFRCQCERDTGKRFHAIPRLVYALGNSESAFSFPKLRKPRSQGGESGAAMRPILQRPQST